MKFTRADRWPIAITLFAGAVALTIPILILGGVLYLYFSYVSMLKDAGEPSSQPTQSVAEKEAR